MKSAIVFSFDEVYCHLDEYVGLGRIRLSPGPSGTVAKVQYNRHVFSANVVIENCKALKNGDIVICINIEKWPPVGILVWSIGLLGTLKTFSVSIPKWLSERDRSHLKIATRRFGPSFPRLAIHDISVDHLAQTITVAFTAPSET